MKDASETQVIRDITRGKYRDFYLIYSRKSTDDTDNQKNSIKYQKSENMRFAFRSGLPVASVSLDGFSTNGLVSERHSGFKEDLELTFGRGNTVQYRVERPKFHRLVQWLSQGYFKGAIFLCWDRASRNKGDDTILRKLMKAGVDMRFTLAQYDKTSAGELHMDIDGMFAEHHSRVTREKVTLTFYNKRKEGIWTHKAPVGYLNLGTMESKPIDPVRGPIVAKLFELAATGEWSLADLARWAIEQGFTMPPMRRQRTPEEVLAEEEDDIRIKIEPISRIPTFNNIHKILTNRFYTGRIRDWNGAWIPSASHSGIVSDVVFWKVQERLASKNCSVQYPDHLEHPLRRFAYCSVCRRAYTPYIQKGLLYYYARCRSGCTNQKKSISFDYIADKIGGLIAKLSFSDDELAELDARATTDFALLDARRTQELEANERRKKKIREDLAYLNKNRLSLLKSGAYTPESLVAEEARLNLELNALNEEEVVSDISMAETVKEVRKLSELLKSTGITYAGAKPLEKEQIIRLIFSELTLSENTLDYKCKKGFATLAGRFFASGDPMGWLSELLSQRDLIQVSVEELSAFISQ